MSLIDEMMEPFVIVDKRRMPDGEGGFTTEWVEGAEFQAAVVLDSSMQAQIAESQGVTSVFTVSTRKSVALDFHDVIKRKSDGKIFRVTSDAGDRKTPKSAGIDMAQVTAEKWSLTT